MSKKSIDLRKSIKIVGKMMRWAMPFLWLTMAGNALVSIAGYIYSLFAGMLMRDCLEAASTASFSALLLELTPTILVALLGLACRFFGHRINNYGSIRIFTKYHQQITSHWLQTTEAMAEKRHTGDAMTQLSGDLEELNGFYTQGLRTMVINPFLQGIAATLTVLWIDLRLLAVVMIIGLISCIVSLCFTPTIRKSRARVRADQDTLSRSLVEILQGQDAIRMSGMEASVSGEYMVAAKQKAANELTNVKATSAVTFSTQIFTTVSTLAFLAVGMWLAAKDVIDFPQIMLAIPMQSLVTTMLASIGTAVNFISTVAVSAERVLETLELSIESEQVKNLPEPTLPPDDMLSFANVTFSYDGKRNILDQCSFSIKANQLVGIVGPSGEGKTTILRLIAGFYENYDGSIYIQGKNIQNSPLEQQRKKVVWMEQKAPLFDMTIAENIAIGGLDDDSMPSREEIVKAAKLANAHDFILAINGGYDARVGEMGSALSGGQKQRIAIARAFISAAPIVLMDEPTAALDGQNEEAVNRAIQAIAQQKNVVIVSHRLSTIRQADQILVMAGGRIAQTGKHSELMAQEGVYRELMHHQELA